MTIHQLGKNFKMYFGFNPPLDMTLTMVKGPDNAQIDLIKLDEIFSQRDSDYNPEECTYKGQEEVSMSIYVELRFGIDALNFLKKLL